MDIKETLEVGGVEYDLVNLEWGGSISAGAPSEIVGAKHSALSGSADLMLRENIFHFPDEGDFIPLKVGARATLRIYKNDIAVRTILFWLTAVKITQGAANVEFSTDTLALSNLVRCAPQARHMPAGWDTVPGDASVKWASGLGDVWSNPSPLYSVFSAFRGAGFNAVPPIYSLGNTIIDIPLQYSSIPEAWNPNSGWVVSSTSLGTSGSPNRGHGTSNMWRNGLTFLVDGEITASGSREQNWGVIKEVSGHFLVSYPAAERVEIVVNFGGGNYVSIAAFPDGGIYARTTNGTTGSLPAGTAKDMSVVRFGVSQTRGWWVKVGSSRIEGTFTPLAGNNYNGVTTFTGILARSFLGGRMAGVQVQRNMFTEYDIPGETDGIFKPTAYIHAPLSQMQEFSRSVKDVEARDVLDDIAEAVCGSWWIDENNIAQFRDMKSLYDGPMKRVYTFDKDVSGYEITDSDMERRSSVQVRYSDVAYSRHKRARVVMHMGEGERMEAGDTSAYLIEPKGAEDWVGVDWNVSQYTPGTGSIQPAIEGSWIYDVDVEGMKENSKQYTYSVEKHTPWSSTVTVNATGNITLIANQGLIESKLKFPIIRGRGKMAYADKLVSVGASNSPAPFTVDARGHVNVKSSAEDIANFILTTLPSNKPSMSKVDIFYAPEISLGDVIVIKAGGDSIFERKLLVLAVKHPSDSLTTELNVLELSSLQRSLTWGQAQYNVLSASSGNTYGAIEPVRDAKGTTWSTVEGNPITYPYGV